MSRIWYLDFLLVIVRNTKTFSFHVRIKLTLLLRDVLLIEFSSDALLIWRRRSSCPLYQVWTLIAVFLPEAHCCIFLSQSCRKVNLLCAVSHWPWVHKAFGLWKLVRISRVPPCRCRLSPQAILIIHCKCAIKRLLIRIYSFRAAFRWLLVQECLIKGAVVGVVTRGFVSHWPLNTFLGG